MQQYIDVVPPNDVRLLNNQTLFFCIRLSNPLPTSLWSVWATCALGISLSGVLHHPSYVHCRIQTIKNTPPTYRRAFDGLYINDTTKTIAKKNISVDAFVVVPRITCTTTFQFYFMWVQKQCETFTVRHSNKNQHQQQSANIIALLLWYFNACAARVHWMTDIVPKMYIKWKLVFASKRCFASIGSFITDQLASE